MLSPYTADLAKKLGTKLAPSERLIASLWSKTSYTLHYRNLQAYLELGLELVKVHQVLAFTQTPWLKPYIELNTAQRAAATTEFEKDFFKLMNNR